MATSRRHARPAPTQSARDVAHVYLHSPRAESELYAIRRSSGENAPGCLPRTSTRRIHAALRSPDSGSNHRSLDAPVKPPGEDDCLSVVRPVGRDRSDAPVSRAPSPDRWRRPGLRYQRVVKRCVAIRVVDNLVAARRKDGIGLDGRIERSSRHCVGLRVRSITQMSRLSGNPVVSDTTSRRSSQTQIDIRVPRRVRRRLQAARRRDRSR